MNCSEFEALSGAYALDALTEEERRAADEHLAQCPRCRGILQQMRTVVELFPLSVPPVDPEPRVKERILARIQAQQQQLPLPAAPARVPGPRWRLPLTVAAVVLLLVLFGGLLTWNLSLQQQVNQLAARQTLGAPTVYTLQGTAGKARISGQLLVFAQQHTNVLVVSGLPPLSGTHVYQGWLLQGKLPASIGLLTLSNGIARLEFEADLSSTTAVAVSLEPGPQPSPLPQGPILAQGTLHPHPR